MPTITLNKKVFEKLVGKKLPLEQLKDRISMLGTDLEKIEGNEIEVEIFPNKSLFGIAPTGLLKILVPESMPSITE